MTSGGNRWRLKLNLIMRNRIAFGPPVNVTKLNNPLQLFLLLGWQMIEAEFHHLDRTVHKRLIQFIFIQLKRREEKLRNPSIPNLKFTSLNFRFGILTH